MGANFFTSEAQSRLEELLEDPVNRCNREIYARLKPIKRDELLARSVHKEFEKYANILQSSMPELDKLVITKGNFSLKTTQFFPPVLTLEINAILDPSGNDLLSEQHLARLRHMTVGKPLFNNDK